MTRAGDLDRRIQFRRAALVDDGFTTSETWADHGSPVWASYRAVSDAERWAAGQVQATTMARFQVRWSSFTAGIDPKDRLVFEGQEYAIVGLKQIGRREAIEITAVAGSD